MRYSNVTLSRLLPSSSQILMSSFLACFGVGWIRANVLFIYKALCRCERQGRRGLGGVCDEKGPGGVCDEKGLGGVCDEKGLGGVCDEKGLRVVWMRRV